MGTSGGYINTLRRWMVEPEENQWSKHHMNNRSPRWWERERAHRLSTPVPLVSRYDQDQADAFADAMAALYKPDLDRQGNFEKTIKMIRHTGAERIYLQMVMGGPSKEPVDSPRKTFIMSLLLRHGLDEEHIVSVHSLIYG
jgi:hypothetical protein